MKNQPLLNLSAMARLLGVKTKWLREEAGAGRIPSVAAGDTFLFDPDTVEAVLRQRASGKPQGRAL
ncbi:MAG: helix-turn-helix domain-containing protein [Planctomycetes bacterium]|nr:helix-turn-helix domain-containing protein [Planctomycetota bacterium]